jgi:2,3-bisphosphoglycerate-independent phosphoglycerate mutase
MFLDGVGLGQADPEINPLVRARMPNMTDLLAGRQLVMNGGGVETPLATLIPTDALLGVDGTPQSATGQTTLLTGVNAARELGYHWGPHPNEPLRQIISRASIFRSLAEGSRLGAFANAYPQRYFDEVERGKRGLSATGLSARAGGLRLRDHDDLRQGQAVTAFFTNQGWRDVLGYTDLPDVTPFQAGQTLAALAREHSFTLFEHYYTDVCGHHRDWPQAIQTLESLDEFLGGVLTNLPANALLIITSDHGNIEDMSVRGHTLNPVPALLVGEARHKIADSIHSLVDLTPAILSVIASSN